MKVKEQDTIKYIFKEFLIEVKKEILEMGQDEQFCKNIENCINEIELESILRDRVFHSDSKTKEFLDKIRKKISKEDAKNSLDVLYNCSLMLNPGLDVLSWLQIANSPILVSNMPSKAGATEN